MASNISFNPLLTTNGSGSFSVQSDGYVQGFAMDDPSIRNSLAGGILASTETLPMWGGIAISEYLPPSTSNGSMGSTVARAALNSAITGFSVANQATNWVTSPQSEAPSAGAGMTIPFYRLGSGARIAVAIDPELVSLDTGLVTQQVSWDFGLQRLCQYTAAYNDQAITSMAWSAGLVTVTFGSAHGRSVGESITISGATPDAYNGTYVITAVPSATTFRYALASDPGAETVPGQMDNGGGAVDCKVLQINIGNSKIIDYDADLNLVNWNNSGSAAVILI